MTESILTAVREAVTAALHVLDGPVLVYFLTVNTSYLLLVILAALEFARHLGRAPFAGHAEAYANPLAPPVSLLVPAHDEELTIAEAVEAMLSLRYPTFEVVVCDDGSRDATFERLRAAYDLVEVPRVLPGDVTLREELLSVHVPADGRTPLVVGRTANAGRAAALNVCLELAQHPLVCMVDADSLLDPDALLAVTQPFADDPRRVAATGGVIRPVNGCAVLAGRVVEVRMPPGWLARIQVVEYLRAFLLGRTGWSRLGALPLISGAFGLFRRDLVVAVGGFDPDCLGEDFELVTALHRHLREQRRDYRVVFVAESVSWTEVPARLRVLAAQRRRWHRGLGQVLRKHARMVLHPRYGRIGLLALPYYVLFELLAPLVELLGIVLVPLGLAHGAVDPAYAWRLLAAAYGYAVFVSLAALAVEEYSFARYSRWRDLGTVVLASVLEQVGYRQLTCWWRLQGLWAELRGARYAWGPMPREGFGVAPGGRGRP